MSEVATGHLERLQRAIEKIAQPLLDQYNEIDEEIKNDEAALREKKEVRAQLRTIVRGINPDLIPLNGKKRGPKPKAHDSGTRVSKERLEALTEWLQERRVELNADGGFRAIDISPREDFDLVFHATGLNKALGLLHDQGILHLDRWVRGMNYEQRPAGKFYKVV